MDKTLTAPLTIVKRNGVAIARIRNLDLSETFNRVDVQGLGNLTAQEVPAVSIRCTASFDMYNVKFRDSAIPDAINRSAESPNQFFENFLLQDGIQLDIFKKVEDAVVSGLKTAKQEPFATIKEMFIESDGFSVAEGQASSRRMSFRYLEPILFTP